MACHLDRELTHRQHGAPLPIRKGATTEGALIGGGAGLVLTLIWAYAANYFGVSLPAGILGGQAAMIVGYVVFVGVSLVTSTNSYNDLDADIQEILDLGRVRSGSVSTPGTATDGGTDVADE